MKRFILITAGLFASNTALADGYGMAGCGLGSIVFGDSPGIVQVLAGTTNGTFASQTFGITTGTSNCVADGVVRVDREQEAFVEANLDALQRDIAAGGGEYLAAFTMLLGCDEAIRPAVYNFSQGAYAMAFPNTDVTPVQALYVLKLQMSLDHDIKAQCSRI